jgi:hypothetical protein
VDDGDAIDAVADLLVMWSRGSLTDTLLADWPIDRMLRLADQVIASSKTSAATD